MMPVYDPIRSLVYTAAERAVRDVWVDGRHLVDDGRLTTLDMATIAAISPRSRRAHWRRFPNATA